MKAEEKAKRLFTEDYAKEWLRRLHECAQMIAKDIDCDSADWFWAMKTHHLYRDEICLYWLVVKYKKEKEGLEQEIERP